MRGAPYREAPQTGQAGRSFEPKFLPFSTRTRRLIGAVLPLAKLDGYCFRIGTHRAFKASIFITITLCWFMYDKNNCNPHFGQRRLAILGNRIGSGRYGCQLKHTVRRVREGKAEVASLETRRL